MSRIFQSFCILTAGLLMGTSPSYADPVYEIGDTGPAGGIVFYVTDGGVNGLEAAPVDQSPGAEWGCYGPDFPGANGTAIGTGVLNTLAIIAGCAEAGIAARLAASYSLNGFNDWFLPSKDELNGLYDQKGVVGGFAHGSYWCSSESLSSNAWNQDFDNGYQIVDSKQYTLRVRAVRAF